MRGWPGVIAPGRFKRAYVFLVVGDNSGRPEPRESLLGAVMPEK
jgi:hypothetical protein